MKKLVAAAAAVATMALGPAFAASASTGRAASASTASTSSKVFGLVDGRILGGTPAQVGAALTQDAAAGVTAVREQLSWNAVEPTQGSYNWGPFDTLVNAVAAHHMSLLVLVQFTPSWARQPGCATWTCPPADPAQFAAFTGLAAARYGTHVKAWEVWNEPNSSYFWAPSANPAAYSQLLNLASAAIRQASPGAFVVSAGLAPEPDDGVDISPVKFLSGVCAAGGLAAVDAVGDHPYSFPVLPDYPAAWNAWQQMNATPASVRSVMTSCGVAAKPIWITEYGAPTNGPGVAATLANYNLASHPTHVDLSLQAAMVKAAVQDAQSASWIGALFFYSASDAGTALTTNQNFFGVTNYDGSLKPAYTALKSSLTGS